MGRGTKESLLKRKITRGDKYFGEGNPFYGKTHSEETKEKIRKSKKEYYETHDAWNKGKNGILKRDEKSIIKSILNNKNTKSILQFDINGNFVCKHDYNPKTYSGILMSCKGEIRQSGGYIWLYEEDCLKNENLIKERVNLFKKEKEEIICPHCEFKSKSRANMLRWHFDNCKHKHERQ